MSRSNRTLLTAASASLRRVQGRRVYLAAPLPAYGSGQYNRAERLLRRYASCVVSARSTWAGTVDWLTRWPQVLTQLDAVVVVVDSSGLLGAGVVKEVVDASARGLPVFFFKPDGQLVPLRRAQLRFLEVSRRRFAAVSFERGESG